MKRDLGTDLVGDACLVTAQELHKQPHLFDCSSIPVDLPVLRGAKSYARTGKIAVKDEARALAVAACKLAGLSDRETERRTGVSATTVPGVMRALEATGRIPSAQQRLTQNLSELAESSAAEMQRLIRDADGHWSASNAGALRSLSIAMGIAVDKGQLLTGQATQIVEQRSGPTLDQVAEWEGKLRQVFGQVVNLPSRPPDLQSGDSHPNTLSTNESSAASTLLDTPVRAERVPGHRLEASPGGGGDRPPPAPAEMPMGSTE